VETNFNGLRATVLETLATGLKHSPDALLHLVYIPELSDPLSLADDERRTFSLIQPPSGSLAIRPDQAARLITLDCSKVAAYLLETHPALDDPLLESSITQAWQETAGRSAHDRALHNDELDLSNLAIGGWIVSNESASVIAQRFRHAAPNHRIGAHTYWVRWFCPDHLHTLWPTLTAPQRTALLGDATWMGIDPFGQVKVYRADHPEEHASAPGNAHKARQLSRDQILAVEEVPTVRDILERWRDQAQLEGISVPHDALARVQSLILEAKDLGIRGPGLTAYALQALPLPEQARSDADWLAAIRALVTEGLPLTELHERLPPQFWQRWQSATRADGRQASAALH